MRRSEAGFTLLEVMAAVAILAIVFTTLARVANQGLYSQGVSRRRFEASLLADEVLAGLEADAVAGVTPELGESESEEGIFRVVIDVSPFDLAMVVAAPADAEGAPPAFGAAGAGGGRALVEAVRTIDVAVSWLEGAEEYRVSRTTYALDATALQPPAGTGTPLEQAGGTGR